MQNVLLAVLLTLFALPQEKSPSFKLSALKEAPEFLGPGWKGPGGLVIDDFKDLSSLTENEKQVAAGLIPQLQPLGITALGDFSYQKDLQSVTLKVFVFDTLDAAEAWWKKKYEHDGWEKFYTKVELPGIRAVDSLQIKKRMILLGKVWITSQQIPAGPSYLTALDKYVEKIRAAQK